MLIYKNRLLELQAQIAKNNLDCYIVTIYDEFLSEYTPLYANCLRWLTGFTGSNGMAIVTKNQVAFFTDGRYIIQAEQELNNYLIYDMSELSPYEWLKHQFNSNFKVGFDGRLISYKSIFTAKSLLDASFIDIDLIKEIWKDKQVKPKTKLIIHDLKYAGTSYQEKIKKIASIMDVDAYVLSCPESVSWLLNIRSNDLNYNPVALVRAVLYKDSKIDLFTDAIIDDDLKNHFNGINIIPLDKFYHYMLKLQNQNIAVDHNLANYNIVVQKNKILNHKINPILLTKACKNSCEIQGMISAHIEDGVAMCKFLYYLENNKSHLTEITAGEKLEDFRKESLDYLSPSFATICGFKGNGAIIHYHANKDTNKEIIGDGILLIDSGGQYPYGTTDVTRTISIGKPSDEQRENFTRVLKGHIALANAKFPEKTNGSQLDALARYHLWQVGLDYQHGTSHGVGYYLNVHEGPHRISKSSTDVALQEGMVLSNEPGYYKKNQYGIRIENLMITKKENNYLYFQTITLAPIDLKLLDYNLLDRSEIRWLNDYHQRIAKELTPYLEQEIIDWIRSHYIALDYHLLTK